MSDLGELRASLARAQRELDAAHDRLNALETEEASPSGSSQTALVPRVLDRQRNQLILVGAISSATTAIVLGLGAYLLAPPSPDPATPVVMLPPPPPAAPEPPAIPQAPPNGTVIGVSDPAPVPPPPPVATEPPRSPWRVARVPETRKEEVPKRAPADEPEGLGSLTVVCLPARCDQITDNGVALGPGHIFSRAVPAGRHRLVLHAPNGVTKTLVAEVRAEQNKDLRVNMQDVGEIF